MKKLIILILLALSSITYGQLSQINVGTSANDGTGESLRSAFQKVNLGITQINTNTGNIALKLAIADTSNMLLRYINKADTALMLSNYAKISATMSTSHAANAITGTDITNWGTAYSDRLKWDGGSTGLTAATGRTSLGGTTAGQALFTLTNPSAITFLRVNADNSVTALSAADFKTALSLSATDVGLGNVTNESKATMFSSPTFTTSVTLPATINLPSGAVLSFNSGDVTLTHGSNVLTIGGGNLALGTNNLTMTGTIASTTERVTKGWFTDLELTNLPTVGNNTFKSALSLTSSDVGLGNVTNESKATMFTSPTFTGDLPKYSTTDTLATQSYARTYGGSGTVTISDVQDEIADSLDTLRPLVVAVADTSDMLDPYITDHEARKAINDSLIARLNGATEISDVAVMLADSTGNAPGNYVTRKALSDSIAANISDIRPYYTFGAGTGAAADSTLFAKGNKSFGSFRIIEDSLYVYSVTNLYMTTGDSLKFNVYYGNGMTRTATDSLFTAPQGAGSYATQTLTPDNERTINHGQDVWVGIIGPQPANMRPKEWILQLNAKIVRD